MTTDLQAQLAPYCPVYERFATVAAKYGSKVAASDHVRELTYGELLRASTHLSKRIAAVVPEGRPVGILIRGSTDMMVAALACIAAGCPYVPLDPAHPEARNVAAMTDASLGALIVAEGFSASHLDLPLLDVSVSTNADPSSDAYRRRSPDGLSAIFYTSGSTGTPKGVCLDSCAVLERVRNATEMMQVTADDNLALLSSPTAIASLWLSFTALLNGATLHFMDPRHLGIGGTLRLFRERRISATFAVPALLRELSHSPDAAGGFRALRVLRTGGDVLPSQDLTLWKSKLPPSCRLWISLASTEAPAVFQWIVPEEWKPDGPLLPVGYARKDVPHEIVDESGTPVMPGQVGELIVKSSALAVGYWTRGALKPMATATDDRATRIFNTKDLVRSRPDGLFEMVGRKDRQVKIRGHRTNLVEVETALRACAGISSSAAIAVQDDQLDLSIVAFVVPTATADSMSSDGLRLALKTRLPPHMIPRRIHVIPRIPLLPTYKVDVQALQNIDRSGARDRSAHASPSQPTRTARQPCCPQIRDVVKAAWVAAMGETSFDTEASFETAGGDSLRALHMWSMIESALGHPLSFDAFDIAMTPAELVAAVEMQCRGEPIANGPMADKPLRVFYMPTAGGDTFSQASFRKAFGPSVTLEVIRYPTVHEMLDTGLRFDLLVECVARQIMTVSNGPVYIMGYSFGGFVAWAAACRINQLGGEIGLVALIDARRQSDAHEPLPVHRYMLQCVIQIVRDPRYAAERAFQNSLAWFLRTSSSRAARAMLRASALLSSARRFKFEYHFADQLRMASARQWRPQPLDCPAALFRSDEFLPSKPDFGWKAVCPSLEVVPVHGTHDTLFDPPNRKHLCDCILAVLKAHDRKTYQPVVATNTSAAQAREALPT